MFATRIATAAVVSVVLMAASAFGQGLAVGDKAPALGEKVVWLKGEPSPEWAPGKVYLLDFWATWCGPCIAGMPHINELAEKYKDDGLVVIGVAIWPRQGMAPTAEWLKTKGDSVKYAVAEDVDGAAATAYMDAIGAQSIPTVMLIDREGRMVWSGHPGQMDEVLEAVMEGTYDTTAVKRLEEANTLASQGDWDGAFKIVDEVIEKNPKKFGELAVRKYMVLYFRLERRDEATAYGKDVFGRIINEDAKALNLLAWEIATAPAADRDMDLALKAAERADELTKGEDPSVIDTVAKVHFERGDVAKAIELQKKAVSLAKEPALKADLQSRLEEYEGKR